MNLRNIKIIIIGYLLTAMIAGMIINHSFYIHTHKTEEGRIVVHAHPYQKGGEPASEPVHQHSSLELFILEHFMLLCMSILIPMLLFKHPCIYKYLSPRFRLQTDSYAACQGRSPPMF
jgi:hypothetical protein